MMEVAEGEKQKEDPRVRTLRYIQLRTWRRVRKYVSPTITLAVVVVAIVKAAPPFIWLAQKNPEAAGYMIAALLAAIIGFFVLVIVSSFVRRQPPGGKE